LLPSIFLIREHTTSAVGVRLETELQIRIVARAAELIYIKLHEKN
jgi:hypothetical protein